MIRKIVLSHFLLMFGYKLFSAYFALYLVERGLVLSQIGYSYFFIYIAFVLFAPVVGILSNRFSPVFLSGVGISGYALYSLGMIAVSPGLPFYFLQVMLGCSAALFFVSSRAMLIESELVHHDAAFGWFYSAPIYANFIAPIIGGIILYFFGFFGVFIASILIYLLNILLRAIHKGEYIASHHAAHAHIGDLKNYLSIFKRIKERGLLNILILSFAMLIVDGFYSSFFILFLKDRGLSQSEIITYVGVFSAALVPISLITVRFLKKAIVSGGIFWGGFIHAASTFVIGAMGYKLPLSGLLFVNTSKSFSDFMMNSRRSGAISKEFPEHAIEAGVVDTIFAPLGVALGALIGGFIVSTFGFQVLFITGAAIVLIVTLLVSLFANKNSD